MFGLIYLFFIIFVSIICSIRDDINLFKSKRNNHTNECYYFDNQGRMRLKTNNDILGNKHLKNGDLVLYDTINDKIINNISENKRNKLIEKNKNNSNITVILADSDMGYDKITGAKYIDINNNKIYVIRTINNISFYMDVNGYFIRPTDFMSNCDRINLNQSIWSNKLNQYLDINTTIKIINKYQGEIKKKLNFAQKEDYDLYYLNSLLKSNFNIDKFIKEK